MQKNCTIKYNKIYTFKCINLLNCTHRQELLYELLQTELTSKCNIELPISFRSCLQDKYDVIMIKSLEQCFSIFLVGSILELFGIICDTPEYKKYKTCRIEKKKREITYLQMCKISGLYRFPQTGCIHFFSFFFIIRVKYKRFLLNIRLLFFPLLLFFAFLPFHKMEN